MSTINLFEYLKSKFFGKEKIELSATDLDAYVKNHSGYQSFKVAEIALFTTIDLVAKTLSKCRFCTVENGREVEGAEFYAWNYAPNKHQTKAEFITDFVSRLLFKNEALIFEASDGQRFVAESFSREVRALREDLFIGVTARGLTFNRTFTSSEVIYLRYNSITIQEILLQMCREYEALMATAKKKYTRTATQKAIVEFSTMATQSKDFAERFNQMLNEDFAAYFSDGDVALPIYEGVTVTDTSPTATRKTADNDINDIGKLREIATQLVANAYHIPPSVVRGDASQLGEATNALIANAVDPIADMLEQGITTRCYGKNAVLGSSYLHIDTTYAKHYDPISSADNIYKSIGSRVINPATAQRYCNMVPDSDPSASAYYMTKNNQTADLAVTEGGEEDA